MKHIRGWNNFFIHPLTFIYLGLCYFTNYTHIYVATLIFVLLHEMGHLIIAIYFKFDIHQVKVLPFGAFLSLNDYGQHETYQEVMVVLGGLTVSLILMIICHYIHQDLFFNINRTILLFNLLPIYPLDGAKLHLLILSYFVDYFKCIRFQIKGSLLTLCICFICVHQLGKSIVLVYLLIQNVHYIKDYRYHYIQTVLHDDSQKRKSKLHQRLLYYRPYNNYYMMNHEFYSLDQMKFYLIKSMKKR